MAYKQKKSPWIFNWIMYVYKRKSNYLHVFLIQIHLEGCLKNSCVSMILNWFLSIKNKEKQQNIFCFEIEKKYYFPLNYCQASAMKILGSSTHRKSNLKKYKRENKNFKDVQRPNK